MKEKDKEISHNADRFVRLKAKFLKWKDLHLVKWNERFATFFDNFALLEQSDQVKEDISTNVVQEVKGGSLYWVQIVLSAVIATFGLLQNSLAVVIGAMLIAPFFIPLQGIAFGIVEGRNKLILKSFIMLMLSTILGVVISYLIAVSVPLKVQTTEILARISPNIFDLFIASFSGVIALLALVYKRLSQSVAGVAMAASLMPPLCVVGIQFGFGFVDNGFGAFLLYVTNVIAIVLVGVFVFLMYGFHSHKDRSYGVITQTFVLVLITLGLSFPLIASVRSEQIKIELINQTEQALLDGIDLIFANLAEIGSLEVQNKDDILNVDVDLRLPENVDLFENDLDSFRDFVGGALGMNVNLNLNIIRTASLNNLDIQNQKIKQELEKIVEENFEKLWIDKALLVRSVVEENENGWELRILYALKGVGDLEEEEKSKFFSYIQEIRDGIEVVYIALNPEVATFEEEKSLNQIESNLSVYLNENLVSGWILSDLKLNNFKLSDLTLYRIDLLLSLPSSLNTDNGRSEVELELKQIFEDFSNQLGLNGRLSVGYEIIFRDFGGEL